MSNTRSALSSVIKTDWLFNSIQSGLGDGVNIIVSVGLTSSSSSIILNLGFSFCNFFFWFNLIVRHRNSVEVLHFAFAESRINVGNSILDEGLSDNDADVGNLLLFRNTESNPEELGLGVIINQLKQKPR